MTSNFSGKAGSLFTNLGQWVTKTPERAIQEAYKAAVRIKQIEDKYFDGNKVSINSEYSENTYSLFQTQLSKHLATIDWHLNIYKIASKLPYAISQDDDDTSPQPLNLQSKLNDKLPSALQQLAFIDFMLARYRLKSSMIEKNSRIGQLLNIPEVDKSVTSTKSHGFELFPTNSRKIADIQKVSPIEKSIIPGSFLQAVKRIGFNLFSYQSYENDIVDELQSSRNRTTTVFKYIAFLLGITLIVQQVSKFAFYSPVIDSLNRIGKIEIHFSQYVQEEALREFRAAKEKIEFQLLVNKIRQSQQKSQEEGRKTDREVTEQANKEIVRENTQGIANREPDLGFEQLLEEETLKIVQEFNKASLEGIKNLCADITAAFTFYGIILAGRQQLKVIKDFLDETLYSLTDTAKAFLIIVFTDTFVGYHSSDGWEALLGTLLNHFGLPENRTFLLTFIATVPVFLDGLFKFWIFQYLRQASPSTGAIYEQMDN